MTKIKCNYVMLDYGKFEDLASFIWIRTWRLPAGVFSLHKGAKVLESHNQNPTFVYGQTAQGNKNMYFKIKWIVLALNAVIIQLQLFSVENTVLLKETTDRSHTDKKLSAWWWKVWRSCIIVECLMMKSLKILHHSYKAPSRCILTT
jgi:hypothetical protein